MAFLNTSLRWFCGKMTHRDHCDVSGLNAGGLERVEVRTILRPINCTTW